MAVNYPHYCSLLPVPRCTLRLLLLYSMLVLCTLSPIVIIPMYNISHIRTIIIRFITTYNIFLPVFHYIDLTIYRSQLQQNNQNTFNQILPHSLYKHFERLQILQYDALRLRSGHYYCFQRSLPLPQICVELFIIH